MKPLFILPAIIAVMSGFLAPSIARAQTDAGTSFFTVKVDAPQNGAIEISPKLPENHKVPLGTVLKIKATPAAGFALDSGYYWTALKSGMYFEFPTPEFEVTIDRNKTVGASFIEKKALKGFKVINNVVYAQLGDKLPTYTALQKFSARKKALEIADAMIQSIARAHGKLEPEPEAVAMDPQAWRQRPPAHTFNAGAVAIAQMGEDSVG